MWGATAGWYHDIAEYGDFNPRTPCGVRRLYFRAFPPSKGISIHAPRVGCDFSGRDDAIHVFYFNPRTPCGVRHYICVIGLGSCHISIHAPRVGCDLKRGGFVGLLCLFQSTHPVWGATGKKGYWASRNLQFQSTHPVWGATANLYKVRGESLCSLHRLHSINSKCYNCGGEKISTPHINWKNVCANLPGML